MVGVWIHRLFGQYCVNFDPLTGKNVVHRAHCGHAQAWAKEPKWQWFFTLGAAEAAARERIGSALRCGDCLGHLAASI